MVLLSFLILASILQGLLEWLPVSSEGQNVLVLLSLAGDPDLALSLSLFLHLGTAMAVIFYYRHLIIKILTPKPSDQPVRELRRILILVTIGTGFTGFILYSSLVELIGVASGGAIMSLVGIFLIITGVLLSFSKRLKGERQFYQVSNKEALILGLIQGFAVLPGISRSGLTIAALLTWIQTDKENALFGSFMMSIPASLGVVFLEVVTETIPTLLWWEIGLTLGLTAIIGYLSMEGLLRISRKMNFALFCIVLGVIAIVLNIPI